MSEPKVIEGTIAADWWVLAGAFQALLYHDEYRDQDEGRAPVVPSYTSAPDQGGYSFTLTDPSPHVIGRVIGRVQFIRNDGATTIRMLIAPEIHAYCWRLYQTLDLMIGGARDFRRLFEPSAEQVIERYYHSRAQGTRITLKQLAEQTGFSYSYLRTVKAAYDKAGKWGSRSKRLQGRAGTKTIE